MNPRSFCAWASPWSARSRNDFSESAKAGVCWPPLHQTHDRPTNRMASPCLINPIILFREFMARASQLGDPSSLKAVISLGTPVRANERVSRQAENRLVLAQEPAVEYDISRKPRAGDNPLRDGADRGGGKASADARQPVAFGFVKPAGQQSTVGFKLLPRVPALRLGDNYGGQQPGLDGWADALAALRVGHTGCVSDQQNALVHNVPSSGAGQQVGMARERSGHIKREPARSFQER